MVNACALPPPPDPHPEDYMSSRVFTIPPHRPFLDALAAGLQAGPGLDPPGLDPLAMSRVTILLPTRRACRALREAFLRASAGRALLLPKMRAVGDIEGDDLTGDGFDSAALPPPMPPLRRQLLLARLVLQWGRQQATAPLLPGQAAMLAAELAAFLDEAQAHDCDLDKLAGIAPADFAEHWQLILQFLTILTEFWPKILAEEGALDPVAHRDAALADLIALWRRAPPSEPVIAAGLTGGLPAITALLGAVAALPQGAVILPGLDPAIDPADWDAIGADPTHPHHEMAGLLRFLELEPASVRPWPLDSGHPTPASPRAALIGEILRPAATTEKWRHIGKIGAAALAGLTRIDCPGPQEEAGTIALLMREALEIPEKTVALVTPDRDLARRVAGELGRWGIEIDDSAGVALNRSPPGVFLRLVLDAAAAGFAPVPLLALLKHPLTGLRRAEARALERQALRGPRPGPGLAGLRAALGGDAPAIDALEAAFAPFLAVLEAEVVGLAELVAAHLLAAEALATPYTETGDTETGAGRLWQEAAGEAAARFGAELLQAAADFPPMRGSHYPALFETLLARSVVRPNFGKHPRLAIWGLTEARLQHADLHILGGLNEGSWPRQAQSDPWLSRPMRASLGLPPPERQIGIAAHDFAQALGAPEAVLTRAARVEGAPTLPSRWLLRLETVLTAAGLDAGALRRDQPVSWQQALDAPRMRRPVAAPAPCPPLSSRPRKLSVTEIGTWMRDPYAIYASRILGLVKLDPIDADPGAADRGQFIHAALDRFVTEFPGALPEDALPVLERIGEECFGPALSRPGIQAFWWPRFKRVAEWFLAMEALRRPDLEESLSELRGRFTIDGPEGPFTVTGRADRIDRVREGGLVVLDYKTGAVPTAKEIAQGLAPQLPLEAVMLSGGGFEGFELGVTVDRLVYWQLSGGDPAGHERVVAEGEAVAALAAAAYEGLEALIAAFDRVETPYRATPRPEWAPRYSDYVHLARVKEWSAAASGDAGGEDGE